MKKALFAILFSLACITTYSQARPTCKAIKSDGTRCKAVILKHNGYCAVHDPEATHCTFIKKDGTRCKMVVKKGQLYCRFHVSKG